MGAKRVVLVGGGHAHLFSLLQTADFLSAGAQLTLVAPAPYHYYSGMGPGLLGGTWEPRQARFHVRKMVEDRGGRFRQGKVASVDSARRLLRLEGGDDVPYDLASFNVGSEVAVGAVPGAAENALPVKPVEGLVRAKRTLEERLAGGTPRVLVVGGGPAGVELAGNAWRLATSRGATADVTLVSAERRILPGFPDRASDLASRSLVRRGIRILTGERVAVFEPGKARATSGRELSFDLALLATGIRPPRLFASSGLATAPDGALLVGPELRSPAHPEVFGGGDCVSLAGRPLDRVGVYAVRQAPVLCRNLLAALRGEPLEAFRPQPRYLLILNLGDGTGLVVWGGFVGRGRWARRWKNWLDTRFMARFQVSGEAA